MGLGVSGKGSFRVTIRTLRVAVKFRVRVLGLAFSGLGYSFIIWGLGVQDLEPPHPDILTLIATLVEPL